jgi:hypothetical protein
MPRNRAISPRPANLVQGGTREGHNRDYACTIFEDCYCHATAEEHELALGELRRYAEITTSGACQFDPGLTIWGHPRCGPCGEGMIGIRHRA